MTHRTKSYKGFYLVPSETKLGMYHVNHVDPEVDVMLPWFLKTAAVLPNGFTHLIDTYYAQYATLGEAA